MARFALTLFLSEELIAAAPKHNVEVLSIDDGPGDSELLSVGLAAESLHNFVELFDEDPDLFEDWSDIILDAEIVED